MAEEMVLVVVETMGMKGDMRGLMVGAMVREERMFVVTGEEVFMIVEIGEVVFVIGGK